MVFLDSNIPMYLVGEPHPNREAAHRAVERLIYDETPLVTSAEVMQEILHRYVAIDRRDMITPALDLLRALADEVYAITEADALQAASLVRLEPRLSARDALHAAVMRRAGVETVLSFDRHFDDLAGVTRIEG